MDGRLERRLIGCGIAGGEEGEEIVVAGRRGSIRIAHHGIESWQPGDLAELVRNFRGT